MISLSSIINIISFGIVSLTFIIGAKCVFIKPVPYFYKICICAVGCYGLSELSSFINAVCSGSYSSDVNINLLGMFGCFCFFISSNVEIAYPNILAKAVNIKKIKSREKKINKAYICAFVVFLLFAVIFIFTIFPIFRKIDVYKASIIVISYFPLLIALYSSIIGIIHPKESFKVIRNYRNINFCAFLFLLINFGSLIAIVKLNWFVVAVINLISVLLLLSITILTIQGTFLTIKRGKDG